MGVFIVREYGTDYEEQKGGENRMAEAMVQAESLVKIYKTKETEVIDGNFPEFTYMICASS